QYRKFNIRSADLTPGDDFAMMREVLGRRFKRLMAEAPRAGSSANPDASDVPPSARQQPYPLEGEGGEVERSETELREGFSERTQDSFEAAPSPALAAHAGKSTQPAPSSAALHPLAQGEGVTAQAARASNIESVEDEGDEHEESP